jgi:ribosome-binding protein aMBF1 (putative translation factor)
MNMAWLEKLMAQKGITFEALRREYHTHPDTIRSWATGKLARPFVVRKIANALGVEFQWLVRNLGVKLVDEKKRTPTTFNNLVKPKKQKKSVAR